VPCVLVLALALRPKCRARARRGNAAPRLRDADRGVAGAVARVISACRYRTRSAMIALRVGMLLPHERGGGRIFWRAHHDGGRWGGARVPFARVGLLQSGRWRSPTLVDLSAAPWPVLGWAAGSSPCHVARVFCPCCAGGGGRGGPLLCGQVTAPTHDAAVSECLARRRSRAFRHLGGRPWKSSHSVVPSRAFPSPGWASRGPPGEARIRLPLSSLPCSLPQRQCAHSSGSVSRRAIACTAGVTAAVNSLVSPGGAGGAPCVGRRVARQRGRRARSHASIIPRRGGGGGVRRRGRGGGALLVVPR